MSSPFGLGSELLNHSNRVVPRNLYGQAVQWLTLETAIGLTIGVAEGKAVGVAIMIEGQMGLTWPRWPRWPRVARAVEDLGFAGLYRSDYITNRHPPQI